MKIESRNILLAILSVILLQGTVSTSKAQDPFIGEIRMFGGDFAPAGWALCNGQPLQISNNTALFSILSNRYGGDGETTFALPDLRGRVAVHAGNGPGLTPKGLGEKGGVETIAPAPTPPTPPTPNIPRRKNVKTVKKGPKKSNIVSGPPVATPPATPATPDVEKNNLQPYLGVNYIIALTGTFPSPN